MNPTTPATALPGPHHFVLSGAIEARALFYIQCKGKHAGRPLRKRIPNCYAVTAAPPYGFALAYAAYIAGAHRHLERGTVIPFNTIGDLSDVLNTYAGRMTPAKLVQLEQLTAADQLYHRMLAQVERLRQLRDSYSRTL